MSTTEAFVARQNIDRYRRLLLVITDPLQRDMVAGLLKAAEAELDRLESPPLMPDCNTQTDAR